MRKSNTNTDSQIDWAHPASSAPRGWDQSLTHRLRVLLHTTPLHDLRRSDNLRDAELRHYDSLALAIKSFDLIIEHTGLDNEVDRETLLRALSPLLSAMDEAVQIAPSPPRHEQMVEKVLAALRNDGERRHPFQLAYQDIDEQGRAITRALEFRLLADHFHPAGGVVLRLSNEAINLYLNALELDIEDAQAAAEAVVQSQLARGRFDEAVQSAKNARLQSVRYQQKVAEILRDTQRDVGRVDWQDEVPRLLNEALQHITLRLATEESILRSAEDRLEVLSPGDDRARAVAEVLRLIRDCRLRHVDLHDQLMRARNLFLDEQARQSFIPTSRTALPELLSQVLEPILGLPRAAAAALVAASLPDFTGAQPPPTLSLAHLLEWQLQPRREIRRMEVTVEQADLTAYGAELAHYPAELRVEAQNILDNASYPIRLSMLLAAAQAQGRSTAVMELLVLLSLQHFAPEDEEATLVANRWVGDCLQADPFFGDDLEIHRVEPAGTAAW
jgi:tetratricopeptide (TPR) repeat protein